MNILSNKDLTRKLGLFSVTNIVIANMIGAGIFTISGKLMENLQNPLIMIVLWVVGGIIALCGALCYGELGAAIPKAGGEYLFLSKLLNNKTGFLSGWVSFVAGFSAPIAASSIGFSEYLFRAVPDLIVIFPFDPENTKKFFSIILISVFTIIHLRGIKFGSIVQNILTILKVGLLVGLVAAGFAVGSGNLANFTSYPSADLSFEGWKSIGLSLMWIMFAYSGWNAASYIGSEIKHPEKNLPRSLFLGTLVVLSIYFFINCLYVFAIQPDQFAGDISVGGIAVRNLFGVISDNILSLLIAVALFSSISAFIILGPRVYYAMAKNGHFFRFASRIHPKYGVPYQSILFQSVISVIIILSGTFDQILTYMGFALGIFPVITVFLVYKLRKSGMSRYRLPGFPLTAIVFISSSLLILILSFLERPVESLIAIAAILTGIPAYYLFKRYNHR